VHVWQGKGLEGAGELHDREPEETEREVAEGGIGGARQGTREEAEGFQRAAARVPGGAWAPPVAGLGLSAAQKGKLCTRWRTELSLISKCGAMVKGKARGIGGVDGTKVPWARAQLAAFREGRARVAGWPFFGRCPVFLAESIFDGRVGLLSTTELIGEGKPTYCYRSDPAAFKCPRSRFYVKVPVRCQPRR